MLGCLRRSNCICWLGVLFHKSSLVSVFKLQVEIAKLYQEAKVNPLAGCLPTLITLPVWIGLYRALSNVADEGLLTEGFFWIPSLAGPTSTAAQKAVSAVLSPQMDAHTISPHPP